jgi:L-gulono-1,4-lactone dehydrogenase
MAEWRNWAGDQRCRPTAIEVPASLDELRAVVAGATEARQRIRASASGHSFNEIALTDGVMVRLDRLRSRLDFDAGSGLFKAQGGVVLGELNRMLDGQGVAFENLGDIDRQTLAGSVSTGTHGTGERFQSVSAQLEAVELVVADGSLVEIDGSDPELLRAARVGLGSLGVVYSATVHTVPAYTVHRVDRPRPLAEVLDGLDDLNGANDHFEFYVFPHTGMALCRESNRSDEPPRPRHPARVYAQEVMLENWVAGLFALAGRHLPSLAPRLARLGSRGVGRSTKIDRSYRVFASERRVRFTEMEYGIPREHAREAIERVLAEAARAQPGVAFPIEVRFGAPDDALLSTSHERATCYIAVHQDRKLDWAPYFRAIERIALDYGGRPHWGKRHFRTASELAPLYPRWNDFQRIRASLDPAGAFGNAYTDRVLGAVATP